MAHPVDGNVFRLDGHRTRRRSTQPWLFAYCVLSGTAGTCAAIATGIVAAGITRVVVWAVVVAAVSVMAGVAYDSGVVDHLVRYFHDHGGGTDESRR